MASGYYHLHPKIWDSEQHLDPEIRKRLLYIADVFLTDLKVPYQINHIYLTGSLASFVWSEQSDWDLHILVNLGTKIDSKFVEEFLDAKSSEFNEKHEIKIKGFKVEVNAKTKEPKYTGKAIFDLQKDSWVNKPKIPQKTEKDKEVKNLVIKYQDTIEDLVRKDAPESEFAAVKDQLKELRQKGLKYNGEYSVGNLVFKGLRHNGSLEVLNKTKLRAEDKELSLEQIYHNLSKLKI